MKSRLATLKPRISAAPSRIAVAAPGSWRAAKTSSTARGYGYKWQQAREGYLRSHPLCVYCDQEGRTTAATVVDHRVPHQGNQELFWDKRNWQSLCAPCHNGRKAREEASGDIPQLLDPDTLDGDALGLVG